MTNEIINTSVEAHKLLVEFVFRSEKKSFGATKAPYPVQGIYLGYGFRFRNIDEREFKGAKLMNVRIKFLSAERALESPDVHFIPKLSPGKEVTVYTNNTIFDIPGTIWISCDIFPEGGGQVRTYQCSRGHKNYVPLTFNKWSNGDYVVPHMEYLQSITNRNIFLLTIVTFVFGLIGVILA